MIQIEAENMGETLIQVLDNLPDAVLMLENNKLSYCNQQADSFFGVSLSELTTSKKKKDKEVLQSCQYLLMNNRCMHELKTPDFNEAATKMMTNDDSS